MHVVVVQRAKLSVVFTMVVHVVVCDDNVTETEAFQQVFETLERYSAAVSVAVLVEQTSQSLPGRVWVVPCGRISVEKSVRLRRDRDQHRHDCNKHHHLRYIHQFNGSHTGQKVSDSDSDLAQRIKITENEENKQFTANKIKAKSNKVK